MKKPLILGKTFFPEKAHSLMRDVGNVLKAREDFLINKPSNLAFLLKKRYSWMNEYIGDGEKGIEVGCGTGLSKLYIKSKNFILTDYADYSWVERKVNALAMSFEDSSLDYIVASNTIHHLAQPSLFFSECSRVLKKDGRLIIQAVNSSLLMRVLLKYLKSEGYSYDVDVYDKDSICNDPSDLWSANNALPNLFFDDIEKFQAHFPFEVIRNRHVECLIFLLSGGVIAKRKTINLPHLLLRIIYGVDVLLIGIAKNIFALQRKVVLRNVK